MTFGPANLHLRDDDRPAEGAARPAFRRWVRLLGESFGLPVTFYLVAFCAMTFPAIASFSERFLADSGDGLQNVWNIWWVKKALVELHQSPWHTTWLHYPVGTTLLGHTLNPFNGLIGIPLSLLLSPVQVHNVAVLLGFVLGGWTAFLLARDATGAYWPSLAAGFAFTFTGYHFAHAEGHLQLVSLEWIPLFALAWIRLLREPTIARGLCASAALGLVILCDYYYFGYCVALALVIAAHRTVRDGDLMLLLRRRYRLPLGAFVVATLLTSGVLAAALFWRSAVDPFVGSHDPTQFSTDLLAPFIPGGHSAYRALTEWYSGRLRGNIHESSVYVGAVVLALACLGFVRRRAVAFSDGALWLVVAAVFFVLSLGPELTLRGDAITGRYMPYAWLESVLPPLKLSGCPVRMMVVVALALSVLAGAGMEAVLRSRVPRPRTAAALLVAAMAADLWPRAMTLSRPEVPEWVYALRDQDGGGGLVDVSGTPETLALYYQTIHEKPMAFGYVSRVPASVEHADALLATYLRAGRFQLVRDGLGLRYLIARVAGGRSQLVDLSRERLVDAAAAPSPQGPGAQ